MLVISTNFKTVGQETQQSIGGTKQERCTCNCWTFLSCNVQEIAKSFPAFKGTCQAEVDWNFTS